VLILIVALLIFYYKKSLVKGILEDYLSNKTGVKIEIGKIDYELFPLNIKADSVKFFQKTQTTEIDVFFNRLNLKGGIGRILKKKKPFFDSIEIKGAVGRVKIEEKKEREKEKIDYQKNLLQLSRNLSYVKKLIVKNSSLDFIFSFQTISLQKVDFILSATDKKEEYNYFLTSEKSEFKNLDQKISVNSILHLTGKFSLLDLPFIEGEFLFSPLTLVSAKKEFVLPEVAFKFRSEFQPDKNTLFFPRFKIDIPPLFEASGPLTVNFKKDLSLFFSSEIHLKDLNRACELLRPYLAQELKGFSVEGAVFFEGEYHYNQDSFQIKTNVKGLVKLKPTQVNYTSPNLAFNNLISGEFRINGPISRLKISGLLNIKNGNLSKKDLKIQNYSLELPLNGTGQIYNSSGFKSELKSLSFYLKNKNFEFSEVEFKGKGSLNFKARKINFSHLEFRVPSFPPFLVTARGDLRPQGGKYFLLKTSNIDFKNFFNLFSPFLPKEILKWEPGGFFNLIMEVKNSPGHQAEWDFSGFLDLSRGKFNNPSFTIAGESINSRMTLNGKYNQSLKNISFSLTLNLPQGESLWNEYYINWRENPFKGKVNGLYHISLKKLDNLSIDASLSSLGRIEAQGLLNLQEPYSCDLQVFASKLNLQSLYNFLSPEQDLEQSSFSVKGEAESQVHLKKEKNELSLVGQVLIKDGTIEKKSNGLLIEGLEAKIPIYFGSGVKKNGKDISFWKDGYILAREFKTSYFSITPLQINIQAKKNKFLIEPFSMEILGGKAFLGKSVLSINSGFSGINGILSFSLQDADISKFPIKSNQFSLKGTAHVNLSRIEITPEIITTQGQGEIDAFDGKIIIRNIKIMRPFSMGRTLSCDVDFKDLNLEKVTDSIPFGRVTGILKGDIKDLAFSYGQPERFIMQIESIKRKRVSQKFSLSAVNDLAVISSGEKTSVSPSTGITRFVSTFRYKKIGIYCSLKNDMFTLRGTIREKGIEYLVKKSWLFGISVVNRNPKGQISFKDMMGRLKRIGQSEKSQ